MKKKFLLYPLLIGIIFVLGLSCGILVNKRITSSKKLTSQSISYPFLSPRIFADNQNDILINFVPLRSKLAAYTDSIKDSIGFYFEYLPSGVSIGINENQEYVFVSLLKVPVVMAVYKNVEQGTTTLNDKLTIAEADRDNKFGDLWRQMTGTQVSVQDAIKFTLTQSDNTAKNLLTHVLTNDDIVDVFDYLDIPKDSDGINLVVSPKNYSSILRSLYLSSYLQKGHSNQILNYLTQSPFNDKLAAGVPTSVSVAHKIGVFDEPNQKSVYTDCGIVYVPSRPYILCIMTRAQESDAQTYMKTISQLIYNYVTTINK